MSPGLIVICGPTATGKSGFAQRLAEQYSLPIVNADSRQIYRDFSIGTAKPSLSDRSSADHFLVDEIDPKITFTVAEYQEKAQKLIANFHRQGLTHPSYGVANQSSLTARTRKARSTRLRSGKACLPLY